MPKQLRSDERTRVCRVAVEEEPAAFVYKPNPWFDVAGGLAQGIATAVAAGAVTLLSPGHLLFIPVALGTGVACSEAARVRPRAQTDFQRIVGDADRTVLKRALTADLDAGLARSEFELALAKTGHQIAAVFLTDEKPSARCSHEQFDLPPTK